MSYLSSLNFSLVGLVRVASITSNGSLEGLPAVEVEGFVQGVGGLGTFPILSTLICSVVSIMIKSSRRNFALTNIKVNWPDSTTAKGIYNVENWTVFKHLSKTILHD